MSRRTSLIAVLLLAACGPKVQSMTKVELDPLPGDHEVKVFADALPQCPYEEVGIIASKDLDATLDRARKMGADGVIGTVLAEEGRPAPDFTLPDTAGAAVSLSDFTDAAAFLVIFMCNHCPFVKHILSGLVDLSRDYMPKGVAIVGINSNDVSSYPDDSPENMARVKAETGMPFTYLYDAAQDVAKLYRAACTPDFFLFDREKRLAYRGQMDGSRPGNDIPVTGADLRAALDAVLQGKAPSTDQKPSLGCNIKWIEGNEPDYFKS